MSAKNIRRKNEASFNIKNNLSKVKNKQLHNNPNKNKIYSDDHLKIQINLLL